ncbi:MAG: efflux RND transporter periplasmic adaptor subunit [Gammaproteobacteria bacterium]|nr:efflux RND transporter periplasmic adaptor subunit [Gammaproteobacteria bacterium]
MVRKIKLMLKCIWFPVLLVVATLQLQACGQSKEAAATKPVSVTAMTIVPKDTPVSLEFVAQTQSSQGVNIQARVSGFLDTRVYIEGSNVKKGDILFEMDKKPFQAQVDAAKAALERYEASVGVARANLARTKPLVAQNALSQRNLDDAQGQFEQASAAVAEAKAELYSAQLNLSYATITSPVDGVSSLSAVADGTYLDAANSQLTTVSVLSPMWINFSLSENSLARILGEEKKGQLTLPEQNEFSVEIILVDGTTFPYRGQIDFSDPSYNADTGTFLIRAQVENPDGALRPNQYVRTQLVGAVRPDAIAVPQRAIQQSAKGQFVWVINKSDKSELRYVTVGDWNGDNWFIDEGLSKGDRVVIDGAIRLAADTLVTVKAADAAKDSDSSSSTSTK